MGSQTAMLLVAVPFFVKTRKAQSQRHDQSLIVVSLGLSISVDSQSLLSCFAHMGLVADALIVLSELFLNKIQRLEALFRRFETCFLLIPTSLEHDNLLSFSYDTCSSDPAPPSSSLHEAHSLPDSDVSRRLSFLQVCARSTTLYANI